MKMYDFCYEKAKKYGDNLRMGEQAIFDFMIQEFKLDVFKIDSNFYSVHPDEKEKIKDAKIIHCAGPRKFWNEINNDHWNKNYNEYIKMGGEKFNFKKYLFKKKIKEALKKIGVYEKIKSKILKVRALIK
jgi:hypothetical protein